MRPLAELEQKIRAHIGWLTMYMEALDHGNYLDMRDYAARQIEEMWEDFEKLTAETRQDVENLTQACVVRNEALERYENGEVGL